MKITPSDIIAETKYKRAKFELLKTQLRHAASDPKTSLHDLQDLILECDKARREFNNFLTTPIA